jgi:hypothetical protein
MPSSLHGRPSTRRKQLLRYPGRSLTLSIEYAFDDMFHSGGRSVTR